jgi:hypothetical protein
MIVDCDSCPVRQTHCADCVVTALMSPSAAELPLDPRERKALSVLVDAGLVSERQAAAVHAQREPWGRYSAVG